MTRQFESALDLIRQRRRTAGNHLVGRRIGDVDPVGSFAVDEASIDEQRDFTGHSCILAVMAARPCGRPWAGPVTADG